MTPDQQRIERLEAKAAELDTKIEKARAEILARIAALDPKEGAILQAELVARLIEPDPHYWSKRPCATCAAITSIIARPFGCDKKRREP